MVSIPKIAGILSCACLLGLSLPMAAQTAENPPAADGMHSHPSAEMDSELPDFAKHNHHENTVQGTNTIAGEVLRSKGEHVYVRRADGKEVHLHTKPTTRVTGEFKKGDHIEVTVNDENNAVAIRVLP